MGLFILVIFFSFLINYVYFINDETLLLSFYFFLFFLIIYMFFKDKFKIFNILKILRKYNLFLYLFFFNNINYIKKSLILYFFYLINKINLNDNLLYN